MIIEAEQETRLIKMIAHHLAENFLEALFSFSKEKNYSAHIGLLAEILDWSREFYHQYHDKILDWEKFKGSSANIYGVVTLDGLITAFGRERIEKFYDENANNATYFFEKYSAIKM